MEERGGGKRLIYMLSTNHTHIFSWRPLDLYKPICYSSPVHQACGHWLCAGSALEAHVD